MKEYKGLFKSVAKVYCHNWRIMVNNALVRDHYVHGAEMPKGAVTLCASLRCEENGAHEYLENLITQIKRFERGHLPSRAIEYWLAGSSIKLLNDLRNLSDLLPYEMNGESDTLRRAIECARNEEMALTNFIMGKSGAGPELTKSEYEIRLDKMLRDLKEDFNAIALACDDVDVAIARKRKMKKMRIARRVRKTSVNGSNAIKECDKVAIVKEVKRRVKSKLDKNIATTFKAELELLYHDEAWSRRCRQWRLNTLYSYTMRSLKLRKNKDAVD